MGLRLRGESWWLRKSVGGKVVETPLGVYGGEANRAEAEAAATAAGKQLVETHAAMKVLAKLGVEIPKAKPAKGEDEPHTVKTWFKKYLDTYTPEKAEDTQRRDNYILPVWVALLGGDKAMTEVKQADILKALATRRKADTGHTTRKTKTQLTEPTVQRERRLIQAVFERAVENDVVAKNPFKGDVKGLKAVKDVARNRLLAEADQVKLIAAMRAERKDACGRSVRMDERQVRWVEFMLETGVRIEGCRGIDPDDDISKDFVTVTEKFGKTRDVPLTKAAKKILKEQLKADGQLWTATQQSMREMLERACKHAGIGKISPHDLRHTFGHRFLVKGGDIYVLSKILGHASVAVTEKHYAYLKREDVRAKMLAVMEGAA